ncbi:hypothetical protein HNR46_004023 [Haloferula luteola]|uniref:FG-GAP repeat protein n=1 Tax=Haloferula luteola TaxID=595692 RepID=A0A840VMA7_9BACT|nr:VCBS repeat-containing protein [Haloferula luteola]MBB5353761.1 hypothetical protein [Haloferula luteola]
MSLLRLSVSVIALAAVPAGAQIHALGPGHDINNAVNLGESLLIDWEGDGGIDLVGFDTTSHRLVRASLSLGASPTSGLPILVREMTASVSARLLLAELDGSPGADLLLLEGDLALVWTSSGRASDPSLGPDLVFALPPGSSALAGKIGVADFDGNGSDDLLLAGPTYGELQSASAYTPGRIVFSFGTEASTCVELPDTGLSSTRVEIEPAWLHGGSPTLSISGSIGSQSYKAIIGFGSGRTPSELARFEDGPELPRNLVELDGVAPPERLAIDLEVDQSTSPVTVQTVLRVDQRLGDEWTELERFPIGPGYSYSFSTVAAADFDGDGTQEVILEAANWSNVPESGRLLLLDDSGPATSLQLKPIDDSISAPRAKVLPDGSGSVLLSSVPSVPIYDLLGNPTTLAGVGSRTTLRQDPLDAELPGDFPIVLQHPVSALALGQMNADSLPDLAVLKSVFAATVVPGSVDETTNLSAGFPFQPEVPAEIYLVDLTVDGLDDAIISRDEGIFWRRTTTGAAGEIQSVSGGTIFTQSGTPTAPTRVLGHADFDSDGDIDLLVLEGVSATISWYENRGLQSTWRRRMISLAGFVQGLDSNGGLLGGWIPGGTRWPDLDNTKIVDVDGDGDFDVVSIPSALGNRVTLHRNTSVGFSLEPLTKELPYIGSDLVPGSQYLQADLLYACFTASGPGFALVIPGETDMLGNPAPTIRLIGDGSAPSEAAVAVALYSPVSKATAVDFDQDGYVDIITAGGLATDLLGNPMGSTKVEWLQSNGDGTFALPVALADPRGITTFLDAADLDGDTFPDVISASEFTQTVEVFMHENLKPLPPFEEWIATFGLTEVGADDDPDRDGKLNAFEYLDGTRPDSPDMEMMAPPMSRFDYYSRSPFAASASISRPRQPGGLVHPVDLERSSDLAAWVTVAEPPTITVDPAYPLWETLTWRIPYPDIYAEPTRFHRFSADAPE